MKVFYELYTWIFLSKHQNATLTQKSRQCAVGGGVLPKSLSLQKAGGPPFNLTQCHMKEIASPDLMMKVLHEVTGVSYRDQMLKILL